MKKKWLALLISALMVMAFFALPTSAAGLNDYEQKLMDKLSAGVDINGTQVYLPAEYVNQAKNYFLSSHDMTELEYNEIVGYVDDAIALVKENAPAGTFSFQALSSDVKNQLLSYGQKAAAVVELTLSYNGKNVKIVDKNNTVVFEDAPAVKTTGAEANFTMLWVVAGSFAVLLIAAVAVSKKAALFSK